MRAQAGGSAARRRRALPAVSSLRTQVVLALVLTLVIAIGATALVDRQVTTTRLRTEAQMLLQRNLAVLAQLVGDTRSEQLTSLRTAAQNLQVLGLTGGTSSARLRQEAVATRRQLVLGGVTMVSSEGDVLAAVGEQPADVAPLIALATMASASQIVPDSDGRLIEVSTVALAADLWLLGSQPFGDTTAFGFRSVLGNDVVLLYDGQVQGSTLSSADALETIAAGAADALTVEVVDGGRPSLVGYTPIGPDAQAAVITPQLLAGLERDLTWARLVSLLLLLLVALVIGATLIRRITRPLVRLTDTAEAVRRGETDLTFDVGSGDEIGSLGQTLESMRRSLEDQLTVISLQTDAIRSATQRIVTARDGERRRMAQDLHDGVQQQLVMLRLRIGMLEEALDPADREALGREVEAVIQRLRETGRAIFPSILSDRGLTGALYSLAVASPVPVDVDLHPDPVPRMSEAVEAGAYFIIAEATTNALKHAEAGRITVRVGLRDPAAAVPAVAGGADDASLLVVVSDDGIGFDVRPEEEGTGLQNLHDRATALGGVAHIRSVRGRGTAVAVRIPLRVGSVGGPLEEEQHRSDAAVEVVGVAEAELAEDGARVLLDGPLRDHQPVGDRGVALPRGHEGEDLHLPRGQARQP